MGPLYPQGPGAPVLIEMYAPDGPRQSVHVELAPGDLAPLERAWADELKRTKYATDEWNRRL